jgi:hypothetical protein
MPASAPTSTPVSLVGVGAGVMFGALRYWNVAGAGATVRGGIVWPSGLGIEVSGSWTRLRGGEGRSWQDEDAPALNAWWVRGGPRLDLASGPQTAFVALHVGGQIFGRVLGVGADVTLGCEWKVGSVALGAAVSGAGALSGDDGSTGWFVEAGPQVRWPL